MSEWSFTSFNSRWLVYETNLTQIGWIIGVDMNLGEELLRILENEIVPTYYGLRDDWILRMKSSRDLIMEKFSTTRMLVEYIDKFYLPVLKNEKHVG